MPPVLTWRPQRPTVETVLGICAVLTLFSGAVQVALYAALGIPPVLGAPFMALAGVVGIVAVVRLGPNFPVTQAAMIPLGLWSVFVVWAALTATWSTATGVVDDKLALLLGVSTLFLLLGICIGFSATAFDAFGRALFAVGLATAIAIFVFTNRGTAGLQSADAVSALKTFADSYQSTTLCVSLAAVVALAQFLSGSHRRSRAMAWAAAWFVLTIATLAGGGRGAAIGGAVAQAMVLAFAMFTFWRKDGSARLLGAMLAVPALLACVLAAGAFLELRGVTRLLVITDSVTDQTGRHALWNAALAMADAHPLFGAGLASFHAANNLESLGLYPHNVFIEVLAETGFAGFVLFAGALAAAFVGVARHARSIPFVQGAVWLGLFACTLVEMNVSGSVTDRFIAFAFGISAGVAGRLARHGAPARDLPLRAPSAKPAAR